MIYDPHSHRAINLQFDSACINFFRRYNSFTRARELVDSSYCFLCGVQLSKYMLQTTTTTTLICIRANTKRTFTVFVLRITYFGTYFYAIFFVHTRSSRRLRSRYLRICTLRILRVQYSSYLLSHISPSIRRAAPHRIRVYTKYTFQFHYLREYYADTMPQRCVLCTYWCWFVLRAAQRGRVRYHICICIYVSVPVRTR